MKISRYMILMLLAVSISACIQLGESVVPSQYFVFKSMPNNSDIYSDKTLSIAIELVDFPEYLNRPQVVQHQDNIVSFTDTKRWATPLEDQVLSLITSNLELLLPEISINVRPWQSNQHFDLNLQIAVKKLSGILGEQSDIDIRWKITDKQGKQFRGHFVDRRSIDESYEGLVLALNRGLNELSEELASALTSE